MEEVIGLSSKVAPERKNRSTVLSRIVPSSKLITEIEKCLENWHFEAMVKGDWIVELRKAS
jgi:hypothetical protein